MTTTKLDKVGVGNCAKCGSDDVNYGTMIPEGESVYYEMECNSCGAWMHEWYQMRFDGIDVMCEDDEHASVEYLQEGDTILNDRTKAEVRHPHLKRDDIIEL